MDIKDIYKRVRAIDENQSVEECGDIMPLPMMPHAPAQADSVTMNVSMNGSGPGGIRDLMGILRNIEHGENPAQDAGGHDELDALFGEPETHDADVLLGAQPAMEEEYANSMQGASGEIKFDSATVTNMGSNDGRGGVKARKMNGGENPMHESLVDRLSELYQEVKGRDITELAKWRDPKHKDKLYTQEPDDGEGYSDYYHDSRPENDPGQKHSTFDRNKDTDKLHYPYGDYQVGQKAQVGDRAKKGLLTKNAIRVVKNRINAAHGDHPTPKLPK
jgi:hypothetical protein